MPDVQGPERIRGSAIDGLQRFCVRSRFRKPLFGDEAHKVGTRDRVDDESQIRWRPAFLSHGFPTLPA
jgi:hypothetical protein